MSAGLQRFGYQSSSTAASREFLRARGLRAVRRGRWPAVSGTRTRGFRRNRSRERRQVNDLRGLRLLNARRLEDIGGLKAFSAMVDVEITYARSLTEFSPIAQMQALEKLVLERCTGLDNLGFTRARGGSGFSTYLM